MHNATIILNIRMGREHTYTSYVLRKLMYVCKQMMPVLHTMVTSLTSTL